MKEKYLRIEKTLNNNDIQTFLNEYAANGYKIISYNEVAMGVSSSKVTVLFEKKRIIL